MNKKQLGFTFIEILIALAIISLILVAITGTMLDSMKAKNQVVFADKVQQNGSYAIAELRKNVMNAKPDGITCGSGYVELINKRNGSISRLSCDTSTNSIASSSADTVSLISNNDVKVTECSSFVVCDPPLGGSVNLVTFTFTLAGNSEDPRVMDSTEKVFTTTVTTRN